MTLEDRISQALESVGSSMQSALQSRLQEVRAELTRALEEDRMSAEADANSKFAAEIAAARAEADQRVATESARLRDEARKSAEADAERMRHQLDELRAAADHERQESEQAGLEIAAAQARAAAAEQALEEAKTAHEEAKTAHEDAFAARAAERQDMMGCIDRLITTVRRIDSATSLSDVLNALSDAAGAETSRTAVLIGAGDAYQIYKLRGFEGIKSSAVPKTDAGSLSRGLPFAPLPADRAGFAFPIVVGGQPVALVYADDVGREDQAVPSPWPELIEILGRAAAARLETLTATRTVQALGAARPAGAVATIGAAPASTTGDDQSARRYARLLVSEIKLYNETAVRAGREHRDLLERLRPEIDRARRLYEERVPPHVAGRMTYFDDELVHTLADGDPSLLGTRR